ncbi:MAG: hypothetical protein Q7S40_07300 [Opitutaceae bacterium]|nr:hypothetical protein [Opitutaceae bacterium]
MDWILRNLPLFVILFVAISIVRSVMRAREAQQKNRHESDELEQQRRIREVQEQIRRKIAERRGETGVPPPLVAPQPPQRVEPPVGVPPLDPFGGGGRVRRALEEIERRLQPPPVPVVEPTRGELERQYRLQEELRAIEQGKQQVKRRAAHAADARDEIARSEPALLTASHARLLVDLSEPHALRRAFVLREVLGPPVGLR